MGTSNVVSAAKRHRSVSDGALVVPHGSSMKRGNFVMNGKGCISRCAFVVGKCCSIDEFDDDDDDKCSPEGAVQPMMP